MTDQPREPSIAALVAELLLAVEALRADLDKLRADFDAAKREGAEQVAELRSGIAEHTRDLVLYDAMIGANREDAEQMNERRYADIDRIDRTVRDLDGSLTQLRGELDRRLHDIASSARR